MPTKRQVAEALVISPRTAQWHTANLRTKLGMETRAQIAVWANEHGLGSTVDRLSEDQ